MRLNDIALRPFTYSYDSFNTCSNPCRITSSDITITTDVSSTLPPLCIIYHSSIHFTSKSIILLYSVPKPMLYTFHHVLPPEDII